MNFLTSSPKWIFRMTLLAIVGVSCTNSEDPASERCTDDHALDVVESRNFRMGVTSWSYGPDVEDREATYQFISANTDIYSEQIDNKIPWSAWINDTALPAEFTEDISYRVSKKPASHQLLLSVSLLNIDRNDLLEDYDGTLPAYTAMNDTFIEEAYLKHLHYLIDRFQPNYVVLAMECNELLMKSETKWNEYKLLMQNVRAAIRQDYPALKLSESVTLHNWFNLSVQDPEKYVAEIDNYVNQLDFAAISYYPFFKGQHTRADFQQAFDFLHLHTGKPIAFVETAHLAEDLSVSGFDLFIESDECEQKDYLETLLLNAYQQDYEFVIWWTFHDYDEIWQVLPDEIKDLGKLWRDTGLLDENGKERPSFSLWKSLKAR